MICKLNNRFCELILKASLCLDFKILSLFINKFTKLVINRKIRMTSNIEYFKQLSKKVITNQDKINFFDQNQRAFYVDIYSDSWSKMMESYSKTENLSSEQLNMIEEMKWREMPEDLKIFAYDFCILNGFVFTGVGN